MDKLQFPPSHQGIKIPVKRLGFFYAFSCKFVQFIVLNQ